jgi:anti-sigma factor RsiW
MKPRCLPVEATLQARGERGLTGAMRSHATECPSCRRSLDEHRMMADVFAQLAATRLRAPAEIVPRVLDRIGPWAVPDPEPRRGRVVVAAAAAAATAATAVAAGTAVALRIHRHRAA